MKNRFGWGLLIGGGVLQVLEGVAQADAVLNNGTFEDTAVGKIVSPVEKFLPLSLGYTLIAAGVVMLWVVPFVKKHV